MDLLAAVFVLFAVIILIIAILALVIIFNIVVRFFNREISAWKEKISIFSCNNFSFKDKQQNRRGAEYDNTYLETFGNNIVNADNCTAEEIKNQLRLFLKDKARKKDDILYFFFNSHGSEGSITGVDDKKVKLQTLINIICDKGYQFCKNQQIFIYVQACRIATGNMLEQRYTVSKQNVTLGLSTQFNNKAYRNHAQGSHYIRNLAITFSEECSRSDIKFILEKVKERTKYSSISIAKKRNIPQENFVLQEPAYQQSKLGDSNRFFHPYNLMKTIKENVDDLVKTITNNVTDEEIMLYITKCKNFFIEGCHLACSFAVWNTDKNGTLNDEKCLQELINKLTIADIF